MSYIVELEPGVWICKTDGDPGRTLVRESAQKFATMKDAAKALTEARKFRPFDRASIQGAKP